MQSFKQVYVDIRNIVPIQEAEALVFKDTVLLTSRPDSYDTVILPAGCVGDERNTVIDTDHLFLPTRAIMRNRRVEIDGEEQKLVCDILIPKNAVRWWKLPNGQVQEQSMIEAIRNGDLTGLSVNFDPKPYPEFVYENKFGREMFGRYTLPFVSLLFGKPQGQQFARLGEEVKLSQQEFMALSRSLNLNYMEDKIKQRCICLEYVEPRVIYAVTEDDGARSIYRVSEATESTATIMNVLTGETAQIDPTVEIWDKLEPVDMASIEVEPTEDVVDDEIIDETRTDEVIDNPDITKQEQSPSNNEHQTFTESKVENTNDSETKQELDENERACAPCDRNKAMIQGKVKGIVDKTTTNQTYKSQVKRADVLQIDSSTEVDNTTEPAPELMQIDALIQMIKDLTQQVSLQSEQIATLEQSVSDIEGTLQNDNSTPDASAQSNLLDETVTNAVRDAMRVAFPDTSEEDNKPKSMIEEFGIPQIKLSLF
jgi:hypothetical protein